MYNNLLCCQITVSDVYSAMSFLDKVFTVYLLKVYNKGVNLCLFCANRAITVYLANTTTKVFGRNRFNIFLISIQ